MAADREMMRRVLEAIPQQPPFRFIDEILGLGDAAVTSAYRFRENEFFYPGHFPGNPVTPGVILIETMAQAGLTALGIYQLLKDDRPGDQPPAITPYFVFADQVEFSSPVRPGERVIVRGEKIYFRRGNIKSKVSITREDGAAVCRGVLTGTGVNRS
jgi:3-hydroxyacyl-[acyl-carrier-protein] dehydratase